MPGAGTPGLRHHYERRFQPPLIQRHIRPGLSDRDGWVARLGLTAAQAKTQQEEWTRWARRRRLGRRATFRFGHAFNYWLRDYGQEHPDWFAMMPDGTRVTPEKPYPSLERAKLCVTNPELLDFIAKRGLEYLEAHPEVLSFSACPNDSRGYCMCPKCKALDPPEGLPTQMNYPKQNFMYPSLSDRYVWFWNQLAQRLGNKCPGRYIDGTMVHESLYDAAKAPDLWKEPRLVDLTPHLRFGTAQTLAVRVHDSAGSGYVAVSFNPV